MKLDEMKRNVDRMAYAARRLNGSMQYIECKEFDSIPWSFILDRKTPSDMALGIREYNSRGIPMMERMFFSNPAHVVQLVCQREELAVKIEKMSREDAVKEIKKYAGV